MSHLIMGVTFGGRSVTYHCSCGQKGTGPTEGQAWRDLMRHVFPETATPATEPRG